MIKIKSWHLTWGGPYLFHFTSFLCLDYLLNVLRKNIPSKGPISIPGTLPVQKMVIWKKIFGNIQEKGGVSSPEIEIGPLILIWFYAALTKRLIVALKKIKNLNILFHIGSSVVLLLYAKLIMKCYKV